MKTGTLLRLAYQNLVNEFERELTEFDMTAQQFSILELVEAGVTNTPARISLELGIDAAAVTRLCDRLVKKGILQRRPCTQDRRVCFLDLTAKAKDLFPKLSNACGAINEQLLSQFNEQEIEQLHESLNRIYKFETKN